MFSLEFADNYTQFTDRLPGFFEEFLIQRHLFARVNHKEMELAALFLQDFLQTVFL